MTVLVDVIIPSKTTYNHASIVKNTIRSLKESETLFNFNVILVESMPFVTDVGQDSTIVFDRPTFCYNRALNLAIVRTKADWVVLANNDLVFHKDWFGQIMIAHEFHPEVESFTPWNSFHNWHEKCFPDNRINTIIGNRVCYELGGWCIVVKRSVLEKIGRLSERCSLWYSDNIYADALIENGVKHALIANSYVDHLTSQTIDFREYITHKDLEAYQSVKREEVIK